MGSREEGEKEKREWGGRSKGKESFSEGWDGLQSGDLERGGMKRDEVWRVGVEPFESSDVEKTRLSKFEGWGLRGGKERGEDRRTGGGEMGEV